MKTALFRVISAVLSVIMLVSMMSCLFGISASAATVTKDSGNMPTYIFDTTYWESNYKEYTKAMPDKSTRFNYLVHGDLGTTLMNETIEFEVKSPNDWAVGLRCDSLFTDGYRVGFNGTHLFIARITDTSTILATSVCDATYTDLYNVSQWHRVKITFEDTDDYTSIEVEIDDRAVPFVDNAIYSSSNINVLESVVTDRKTLGGKFYDFDPIRRELNTYIEINPEKIAQTAMTAAINPRGVMYLRSVDADLTDATDPYRITFIGDSITHGVAVKHNQTLSHEVNELLGYNYDCYNAGVSGTMAYVGIGRNQTYVHQNQFVAAKGNRADLVVVMLGTNDSRCIMDSDEVMFTGDELESWHQRWLTEYSDLVDAVNYEGTQLVFVTPPWLCIQNWTDETIRKMGEWVRELVDMYDNAVLFDMYAVTENKPEWLDDKLHPNATGYENMASAFTAWLVNESGISLNKTAARTIDISPVDNSDYKQAHSTVINNYSGTFNKDNFSIVSSGNDIVLGDDYIQTKDANVSAIMGAISNDKYSLGSKWSVTFRYKQPSTPSKTIDPATTKWAAGQHRYSNMTIGNIELKMYHFKNSNNSNYVSGYRVLYNNIDVIDPIAANNLLDDATYKIEYLRGELKITRTNDNFTICNVDLKDLDNPVDADYRFDDLRLAMTMYESEAYCRWEDLIVESADPVVGNYDITATENGHIEVDGVILDAENKLYIGENIVLTAVCDTEGYMFSKWVDGEGNKLSTNLEYPISITEDEIVIKAVFEKFCAYADMNISAQAGGSYYIDGAAYDYNKDYLVGEEVTLSAEADSGYEFGYWLDSFGNIASEKPSFKVTLTLNTEYTAVFFATDATNATIVFVGRGGVVTGTHTVAVGTKVTLPALPNTYGYTALYWDVNGAAMDAGEKLTVNQSVVIKAISAKDDASYTVSVEGGTVGGLESDSFAYNTKVTVAFDNSLLGDDEVFFGWHNAASTNDNSIISYEQVYTFYVGADVNLVAVIAKSYADAKPVIDVTDVTLVQNGAKATFLTERTVPTGYTVVKSGVIYTADATKAELLTIDNIGGTVFTKTAASTSANGQLRLTLSSKDGSAITVYVVSYLTYLDKSGNEYIIYSDVFSATTVAVS